MALIERIFWVDDGDGFYFEPGSKDRKLRKLLLSLGEGGEYPSLISQDCELYAFLGNEFFCIKGMAGTVSKEPNRWLEDKQEFQKAVSLCVNEAHGHTSLFLVDWSLSHVTWANLPLEKRTNALFLNALAREKNSLTGILVCYTAMSQDELFRKDYARQSKKFETTKSSKPTLRTIKLLWRWNDIDSTYFTLYRQIESLIKG